MSRALVVDDTDLGRLSLSEELRRVGFQVHAAADAYEAISALPGVEPSVMVVDFQLPGIDGIDLVERVRDFSDVPIVLITAYGSEALCDRAERAGVQTVLDFNRDLDAVGETAKELVVSRAAEPSPASGLDADRLRRRHDALLRVSLEKALYEAHGNVSEVARLLGSSRGSIRYQMKRLGLSPD